ncbi:hypothetical protein SC1083_0541 [Aggregatibacter actinomycetemcomitans serotype e str. SC1083]|uniref:Uncharacterized protein n=1 Tax=Aggregatibacter actinomycetemcomitans serotype e str. SC1083 TaxID=907488 RepID=G4A6V1_AGGAC|nr:hypothetical protein SC1083_0541 [Aggregatibacter actinomycetemcomitans serotype e str. SC1083]
MLFSLIKTLYKLLHNKKMCSIKKHTFYDVCFLNMISTYL